MKCFLFYIWNHYLIYGKTSHKRKTFSCQWNPFFSFFFFCLKKQFLRIVETYFLLNASSGAHKDISKLDNTISWKPLWEKFEVFCTPNTKWRPCITFVKLNGNHILMANTFKLHEYQTFGLMEMHNMGKI